MSDRLKDRVAIFTGGGRGIGWAIAATAAREGVKVIVASLDQRRGESAAESLRDGGYQATFIQTNVTRKEQVENLFERTPCLFGDVNIFVNDAGVYDSAACWEESEALWELIFRANLMGVVLPSQ